MRCGLAATAHVFSTFLFALYELQQSVRFGRSLLLAGWRDDFDTQRLRSHPVRVHGTGLAPLHLANSAWRKGYGGIVASAVLHRTATPPVCQRETGGPYA